MDKNENARVLGIAYEIEETNCNETIKKLDFREKCGYVKRDMKFYPLNSINEEIACICYYADEKNLYFSKIIGDDKNIADQIIRCKGSSGTNLEYFLNTCNAIRELIKESSKNDVEKAFYVKNEKHLFDLEKLIVAKKKEQDKLNKLITPTV